MTTSKERLMAAIHRGKPDRLPVSVHQWQEYHLKYYLNGIDALSAFKKFGLDAKICITDSRTTLLGKKLEDQNNTDKWIDEVKVVNNEPHKVVIKHIIHTPKDNLSYTIEENEKTTWIIEKPIKRFEDVELIKYMPVPKLDKKEVSKAYDFVGDSGILGGCIWGDQAGCWQRACIYYGIEEMIYTAIDNPDWVHCFLNILLEKKLQYIYESLNGTKFDLVETDGGDASSTVI